MRKQNIYYMSITLSEILEIYLNIIQIVISINHYQSTRETLKLIPQIKWNLTELMNLCREGNNAQ